MGLVIGIIVVVVLLLLAVIIIAGYNGLVRARNAYKNAFAQIDVQLRRRFDLIPNLIETAKAYMAHERQTLNQRTLHLDVGYAHFHVIVEDDMVQSQNGFDCGKGHFTQLLPVPRVL